MSVGNKKIPLIISNIKLCIITLAAFSLFILVLNHTRGL
ncbi:unnamed protein product, partial [marine sediment metagenome]